jgi:hypothetical protein
MQLLTSSDHMKPGWLWISPCTCTQHSSMTKHVTSCATPGGNAALQKSYYFILRLRCCWPASDKSQCCTGAPNTNSRPCRCRRCCHLHHLF